MQVLSRRAASHEHYEQTFLPVIQRIDERIDEIRGLVPDIVERVSAEVDAGELDRYWASKLEMLQELELM